MENEFESGALDEGAVVFQKLEDDTFAIMGSNLIPGEEVEVSTKDGETRSVIVGKILNEQDGIQTAEFTWATPAYTDIDYSQGQIYFTNTEPGTWVVTGKGLKEGKEVKVTRKGKTTKEKVIVDLIINDEDGVQTATFTNPATKGKKND